MTGYTRHLPFLCLMIASMVIAGCDDGRSPDKKAPAKVHVVMKTTMGTIKMELNRDRAPVSVANFLQYVDDRHYDGTIFHRVMPNFMIQGGGFDPNMKERTTRAPIRNEAGNGLSNVLGSVAMARTNDPNSATSQFYISVVDNTRVLDRAYAPDGVGYAVFGKVTEGMDVANAIVNVKTHTVGGRENVPVEPVVILTIRRAK